MKIAKTVVQITILHDAADLVEEATLNRIAQEIDEGDWLGQVAVISTEEVPPERVSAECKALGNDGTFFDGWDD